MAKIVVVAIAATLFGAVLGMRVWSPATLHRHPGVVPLSLGSLVVVVGFLCVGHTPTVVVATVLLSGFILMGYGFRRERTRD
jgi:hypothetical protein